ncbi:MAG: hypothetical protein QXW77_00825 [Candidatus Hadarchaeales archaeon]
MLAEFCSWCREFVVNKNMECKECESCLRCSNFDGECCRNKTAVSGYIKEMGRPSYVVGVGPPLCRKYCPLLDEDARRRAALLSGAETVQAAGVEKSEIEVLLHRILYTPLPKFWLAENAPCITFEIDFSETMYYHMVLLGRCVWDIPDEIILEIPAAASRSSARHRSGRTAP